MPKLSEIGNSDAVDSVYAARAIVYVEAHADSEVFQRIVGMPNAHKVDFKAPRPDGGGYKVVCAQVHQERQNGNHQVFGLIDGESAAPLGSLDDLIAAKGAIFSLSSNDGVFCLAAHELENLMLLHGDICGFIVDDVKLNELSTRNRAEVEKTLRRLARRFFNAAILKYASLHLGNGDKKYPLVEVGRFQEMKDSTQSIRTALTKVIVDSGWDGDVFLRQVFEIITAVRRRFRDENLSGRVRSSHMIRLSDGKGLMKCMVSHYQTFNKIEGHLVRKLVSSEYAGEFREEILAAVAS